MWTDWMVFCLLFMGVQGQVYYVENQLELRDHYDFSIHYQDSHLYCENAYCDTWESFSESNDPATFGTRVESISRDQCMDMCLCDEECALVYFGTYTCYDSRSYEGYEQYGPYEEYGEYANQNESTPEYGQYGEEGPLFSQCSMCRIFHNFNEFDRVSPLTGYNETFRWNPTLQGDPANTFVGTKDDLLFPLFHNAGFCAEPEGCQNPLSFSGTSALEGVGDSNCDCIAFQDCPGNTTEETDPVEEDPCLEEDFSESTDYFGPMIYEETTPTRYSPFSGEAVDTILLPGASSAKACRAECFNTAGCYSYMSFANGECSIIIGSSVGQTPSRRDSFNETGRLSQTCNNADKISTSFKKVTEFSCKFQTAEETQALIDRLYALNGVDASAPLNEWIIQHGQKAKTQLVVLDNPSQHINGATWRWVEFVVRTYTREKKVGRRRRSTIFTSLEPARADRELVQGILSGLNLPDEVVVLETTQPVTTELSQLSEEGQFTADCAIRWTGQIRLDGTGGYGWAIQCSCAEGFVDNGDGQGCQPIPGTPCLVGDFTIEQSVSFLEKTDQLGIVPTECGENEVCQTEMMRDGDRRHYTGFCNDQSACEADADKKLEGQICRYIRKERSYSSMCLSRELKTQTTTTCRN